MPAVYGIGVGAGDEDGRVGAGEADGAGDPAGAGDAAGDGTGDTVGVGVAVIARSSKVLALSGLR